MEAVIPETNDCLSKDEFLAAQRPRISYQELCKQCQTGEVAWRLADRTAARGPKKVRVFSVHSLSPEGRERWQKMQLEKLDAESGRSTEAAPAFSLTSADAPQPGQRDLFWSDSVRALDIPPEEKDVVAARLVVVRQASNGDYRAAGMSKREHRNRLAEENNVSTRTIDRWCARWSPTVSKARPDGDLTTLMKERPGPAPGDKRKLEPWFAAALAEGFVVLKLNIRQSFQRALRLLHEKQASPGHRVYTLYPIPSYDTSKRYLRSLNSFEQARRQGSDALKAACGHSDRTYRDLPSLGRVECDEWKCDFLCYQESRPREVRRFWLLTMLDERSLYPLDWRLVGGSERDVRHGIAEEDEIALIEGVVREYGVPGSLHTDRGRFRGVTFGGRFLYEVEDEKFARVNGILDDLGIRRNLPREKNPRGTRLERVHRFFADQARELPGWIGSNTRERKMAPGDRQAQEHAESIAGKRSTTPLFSDAQALEKIAAWMELWRDHVSRGTDMEGLSPREQFLRNIPPGGFRRISAEELALATAEVYEHELIELGGIVQLPDRSRYSAPVLALVAGERRAVKRLRHDHSFVKVLPLRKGEEPVRAERRIPVGCNDRPGLARASEFQARVRRIAAVDWTAANDVKGSEASPVRATTRPEPEIDPGKFIEPTPEPEPAAPSFYDLKECTVEELEQD